jgi:hypothetical protein
MLDTDLHVEVHSDSPEEGQPRSEGVDVQSGFEASPRKYIWEDVEVELILLLLRYVFSQSHFDSEI